MTESLKSRYLFFVVERRLFMSDQAYFLQFFMYDGHVRAPKVLPGKITITKYETE